MFGLEDNRSIAKAAEGSGKHINGFWYVIFGDQIKTRN